MKTLITNQGLMNMKTPAYLALCVAILLSVGQTIAMTKDKDDADKPGKENESVTKLVKHPAAEAGKGKKEEKREEKRDEKKKEAIREKKSNLKETHLKTVNERTEERQKHQAHRIQEGIAKGYLTPAEISKLSSQQKSIESLQQAMNADGKVTKEEARQLHQQLDTASINIFAEKHDADGNTKPVLRIGKNVMLKNDIAQKLGNENLSRQDARAFLGDLHKMLGLKKTLATGNLTDAERAAVQGQYNELLNQYFELTSPATP